MNVIKTVEELKEHLKDINGDIGFVPTMGALHKGHVSLIKKSVEENDATVVSIFVNPAQFLKGEDLDKYPKREQADLKICSLTGVDVVFMPQIDTMYKNDEVSLIAPDKKGYILEGLKRPGHFDGVLRVVNKLFNIVKPDRAYFGKKDAQQLYLIRKMVDDFFMDIDIIGCDLIRDEDGLALSSRNVYLSEDQREKALAIPRSLKRAAKSVSSGRKDALEIKALIKETTKELEVEYIEVINRDFEQVRTITLKETIIVIAARVGSVRLIDNIWI